MKKIIILNDLYVDSKIRKNGTGEKLIQATIDLAKELETNLIRLRTSKGNLIAQKLYHKMGFVRDENLYGYDLVLK